MRNAIASMILALTIALLPVYNRIAVLDMNRTSKDNLFLVICTLTSLMFSHRQREFPLKGWVALAIAFFLIVVNQHNVASINVAIYSFYSVCSIALFVRFYECFERKYLEWFLNAMCAGVIIQAVYVAFNLSGHSLELIIAGIFNDNLEVKGTIFNTFGSSPGSLGNPNLLGGYVALCIPAFFRKKWVYLIPIALFVLIASGSVISILSAAAGLAYYATRNKIHKKWFYASASFAMILFFFTGMNGMDSGRLEIWQNNLSMLERTNWIIGNGVGWFQDQRAMWGGAVVAQEHSGFMTILNTFGVFGLLYLAYFLVIYCLKKEANKLFSTVLFIAFCNAYGHFSIQQSTMMVVIILAAAICSAKDEDEFNMEWAEPSK